MKGTLKPTIEEQMSKTGHGTLLMKVFIIKGTIKEGIEFQIGHTFKSFVVTYKNREVIFSMEEMVNEAVALIDKVKQK